VALRQTRPCDSRFFFGTTPEFWINLQTTYELGKEQAEHMGEIEREVRRYATA
jgi:plasmid maintenance system antidote protein VapI